MAVLSEHMMPVLLALAFSAVIVLISNSLPTAAKKFYFQSSAFAAGLAASFTYLLLHSAKLKIFIDAFTALPQEMRLILSVFIITGVYFGGALYVGIVSPPSASDAASSGNFPASCDNVVDFSVADHLPADDTKLFEDVFKKYICCILHLLLIP